MATTLSMSAFVSGVVVLPNGMPYLVICRASHHRQAEPMWDGMINLSLRCCACHKAGMWQAICVDLDVSAFAESLDEAKASLATCLELYLGTSDQVHPWT